MNAIETLYRNSGLVTEDNYIKVNDKLWVGPFGQESMSYMKNIGQAQNIASSKDLEEIISEYLEIVAIQEACGIPSVRQIFEKKYSTIWISDDIGETESSRVSVKLTHLNTTSSFHHMFNESEDWCILVRRIP